MVSQVFCAKLKRLLDKLIWVCYITVLWICGKKEERKNIVYIVTKNSKSTYFVGYIPYT